MYVHKVSIILYDEYLQLYIKREYNVLYVILFTKVTCNMILKCLEQSLQCLPSHTHSEWAGERAAEPSKVDTECYFYTRKCKGQ